jgi:hypothetical protein
MSVKITYRITIIVLLLCMASLPLAADSLSASYNPYVYAAGYDSSDPQFFLTSLFLQPGNAVSVQYVFTLSDTSFDLYTGLGYSQLFDTRVTGLEFAKGFTSIFFDVGVSYHISNILSLSGFMRMHNSQYNNSKTLFAHIEVGISPKITFVNVSKDKSFQRAAKITFPLIMDMRKDMLYAFSFGVGLEIELLLRQDDNARLSDVNVTLEDNAL